jgi:hypothetical protein
VTPSSSRMASWPVGRLRPGTPLDGRMSELHALRLRTPRGARYHARVRLRSDIHQCVRASAEPALLAQSGGQPHAPLVIHTLCARKSAPDWLTPAKPSPSSCCCHGLDSAVTGCCGGAWSWAGDVRTKYIIAILVADVYHGWGVILPKEELGTWRVGLPLVRAAVWKPWPMMTQQPDVPHNKSLGRTDATSRSIR